MERTTLEQLVEEQWGVYHRASWKEKLGLIRHSFSMYIPHADDIYESLHIDLDDHAGLKYPVNKAVAIDDSHSIKGFARFVFALGEGKTKTFAWVTADGIKEWILSRDDTVLWVDIPEFEEGFFIRYLDFRDECTSQEKLDRLGG